MEKKKRSPIMVIGFAVLIGFLVIALLNGTIRPTNVVAAKVGLAPGTLLTADLLEVRSIPAGGVPDEILTSTGRMYQALNKDTVISFLGQILLI